MSRPRWSKVTANGTVPGSEFTVGESARVSWWRTRNTRIALPLHRTATTRVQHIRDVVVRGDAHRELAVGRNDLTQLKRVALYGEDGNRVAPGVDRQQQRVLGVVHERALRGEVVDDRTGERAAPSAGRVGRREAEGAVVGPVVRGDGVAVGIFVLHEHDVVGTLAMIVAVVVMILAVVSKRRRCDEGHNRDRENGSRGKAAKANHAIRGRSAGAVRRAGDSLQPIPAPLVTERGRGDCEADGRPRTLPPCPTATMRTTTSS
jgi:hypothetical protein